MTLIELKNHLQNIEALNFITPTSTAIPAHFHVTELGLNTRHFIDCGTDIHTETAACFQIWVATDTDHRLSPEKFLTIIENSKIVLGNLNPEIEVEYQTDTIGRYSLTFENGTFKLQAKQTDCLAKEKCGIPTEKKKISLVSLGQDNTATSCTPGGGCC